MSEWFKEHAWKSTPPARADAHEIPPTHSRSTTSRNIDTHRHVVLNHRVDRGCWGVCDTVLTQSDLQLTPKNIGAHRRAAVKRLPLVLRFRQSSAERSGRRRS